MLKKSILSLALLSATLSGYTNTFESDTATFVIPSNPPTKPGSNVTYWHESYIEVTYDKEINNQDISYHYHIKNIGDVPMRKIYIGYRKYQAGCQAPPQNIASLTASIPEWNVRLERQEENLNQCIITDTENHDYPLNPGETLTITAHLKKDDLAFENFGWEALFTRAPIRLNGLIKKAKDASEI